MPNNVVSEVSCRRLSRRSAPRETVRDLLRDGHVVLEGRSVHSVTVYQSVLRHPNDAGRARAHARAILSEAGRWRPLPHRVVLLTDDVDTALGRAERRDGRRLSTQERALHHRAAALFVDLANDDPDRCTILDRRDHDTSAAVDQLTWHLQAHNSSSRGRPGGREDRIEAFFPTDDATRQAWTTRSGGLTTGRGGATGRTPVTLPPPCGF